MKSEYNNNVNNLNTLKYTLDMIMQK